VSGRYATVLNKGSGSLARREETSGTSQPAKGLRLAVWFALLALVACDSGRDGDALIPRAPLGRPTDTENLVVGLVGTMTGPDAWRGEDAYEGADLAVHELNAAIDEGPPFRLLTLDDEGRPEEALSSLERISELENLVGVVYAGPPGALPEAEDALAARGVPALLLYGDLYSERRLSEHVFQISPPMVWEARRIVAYIGGDRRYERAGVLALRSGTGSTAARSLRAAADDRGLGRPQVARYDPGHPRPALRELRRGHTEVVVVQGSPPDFGDVLVALSDMDATYATTATARIASAPRRVRVARRRSGWWAPQVIFLDLGFSARTRASVPAGTVAAETYGRGAYYLPVPSFQRFRAAFREWWGGKRPLGWQYRAYDATKAIGWAVRRTEAGKDIAGALEELRGKRFGSLEVTFGPEDHNAIDPSTLGLWVVPRPDAVVRERDRRPERLPWVPLARGFSADGETLDIPSEDWAHLIKGPPSQGAPAPRFSRLKYGVRSGRKDPVH
jgi:ABC-type branched-subunit amino acid transport system substrate-binding protein